MRENNIKNALDVVNSTTIEKSGLDEIKNILDNFLNPFLIFPFLTAGFGFYLLITGLELKMELSKNFRFWIGLFIFFISIGEMMIIVTGGKVVI